MKKNVGSADKVIRIVAALGIVALYWLGIISGPILLIIMGLLTITFLGTALTGYCPLYTVFGFSSCPVKEANINDDL